MFRAIFLRAFHTVFIFRKQFGYYFLRYRVTATAKTGDNIFDVLKLFTLKNISIVVLQLY